MPTVLFIERNGNRKEVRTSADVTLLQVAQANGIDMEGACEGAMACSTCHVIVADDWFAKLPIALATEEDMLDLTYGVTKASRLACQIVVTDILDGLTVSLPSATRNMMD
ncbi:MAG: 2Fe-2S iron-sulfur cluster binding domain-containing protein [Rhodospirillaceae bacterium]|nr:2Fe-2S iron-sulfur cluster binding domain-containing protein [Rhodospirillaceae bacterium]